MKKIEMKPAYVWDCDECGIENFERTIVLSLEELTQDDLDQIGEELLESMMNDTERGTFQSMPNHVTCRNCNIEYETYHILWPEHGDEDDKY